ncbi:GNAT family N-acetyltransferase [Paenibacillus cymbidii]|uniref:GNAT family N-acetyltransferase n=1 Tax=Paenibacillus cymbidii TaxID=1639034 RepID=UPI0010813F30|nr:GNAT family N-acetyltransferase [Paenibacillus cymbidii]
MELAYRVNDVCQVEEVEDVFRASGIRRPIGDAERIARMIAHADVIVTARDGGRLVGLLRALTDYSYCCYISDIAVDGAYQRMGVGKRLLELLRHELGEDEVQYVLTSAPGAVGFYEKLGFERADKAFVIRRKRNT